MCGRYVFRNTPDHSNKDVAANPQWFSLWKSIQLSQPRYNIAPTQAVPVLTSQGARDMAFGIKLDWSNSHLINAKTENLLSSRYWKPMVFMNQKVRRVHCVTKGEPLPPAFQRLCL